MQVKCHDFYGKTHVINKQDLINRLSIYGIYISNSRVLLIQDPRSLRWELPGGNVESGEELLESLSREFREETGLVIKDVPRFFSEWTEYFFDITTQQGWHVNRKFYLIRKARGDLLIKGNGDDSAAARFIELNKLDTINIMPRIKDVILKAVHEKFHRSKE